jgi:Uncharacterised nucleotidyltransferase
LATPFRNAKNVSNIAASPEWAALLECSSPHPDLARLGNLLGEASAPDLLDLAEEHGVVALLAASLRHYETELDPPGIAQEIRDAHRVQVLASLKMAAELFRLAGLFRDLKLEAMLVKGPALAVRAYGDAGARQYGDLDFLLRQRDILGGTELLIAAGYKPEISLDAIRAQKIPGQYLFVRANAPLLVELHTERTMRYYPRGVPIEDFFARRQIVFVDGHEIPALSIEDELILICIHGAKHLWERLTLVADVAAFTARQTELHWERCFATARGIGADRMLRTGLLLARNLLRAPLPPNILDRLQSDSQAARLATQIAAWLPNAGHAPPGLLSRALYRLCMRGNTFSGVAYLWRLTFSPTQEDWAPRAGQESAGHLASLRRPMRLAKKYRSEKAP